MITPDASLDLLRDVAPCHGCGERRVVCAHGTCTACHRAYDSRASGVRSAGLHGARGGDDTPVHLCCGWYGPLSVLP